MIKYTYKAKTTEGLAVTGIVEAATKKDALRLLHDRKLVVFSIREKGKGYLFSLMSKLKGVSRKDVVTFTRQLATMINAGLTLNHSLNLLQEQARPAMARLLIDVVKKVEGGSAFHKALSANPETFSKVYISLVKSGEASGKLDQILNQLADTLEEQDSFTRKIKGALIYPAIISVGMIVVAFIMMVYVLPKLTVMYKEMSVDLPLQTQILIAVSNFMARFWYLIILLVFGFVSGFIRWRKTKSGREITDRTILKIPIIGKLVTKIVLTQISRILAMLIMAGVPILEALMIVADGADNVVFQRSIRLASAEVEKGLPLTEALEKFEEYPAVIIQMLSVGEQTGKVGEVLNKVANYFEQESEAAIKGLTTAIEPLMMIILGIGVGFMVISIITPIYNLTAKF